MRKVYVNTGAIRDSAVAQALSEIANASQDADVTDIGTAYTFAGTPTATRVLNVTSPTVANIAAVLATLIQDLQAGGANRTT